MKKTVIMIAVAVLLLLILFVPLPRGTYRDGGTKDYRALTYRIVVWNRLTDGLSGDENGVYHKTSVFWFPHNFKSIDELWEKESGGETKNDFTFTEDPPAQAKGLREKYPAYFGLSAFKGLEVYVWQLAPESYSCGLLEGTNREKTLEELMALKGASVEEMREILASYDVPKENIFITPWQNPVSSYIGEYWLTPENETPEAAAERKRQYVEGLREMLLGENPAVTKVCCVNWTEDSSILSCLNAEKLTVGSVRHLPVFRLDTKEDLDRFREKFRDVLTFDRGCGEVPSFDDVTAGYDGGFFAGHTLIFAYVTAGSGSLRFGIRDIYNDGSLFCLNVTQTNTPEVGTADMAGWLLIAEVPDADVAFVTDFDTKLVEN